MNTSGEFLRLEYYGSSDIGLVRSENQDCMGKFPRDDLNLYSEKGQLFIVADGMGGHTGGREASSTAVETIIDTYSRSVTGSETEQVMEAVYSANRQIYLKAQASTENKKMGTTCVVLLLKNNKAVAAHVGDSRIYKIEDNRIEQLTTDHTQVQEMLNRGILTKSEAENYPSKSVLARALGAENTVKIDARDDIELRDGQIFVLCTDGLAKVLPDEILNLTAENNPSEACDKLIKIANERGGKDNVTVQVIKIVSFHKPDPAVKKKRSFLPFLFIIAVILLVAAYLNREKLKSIFAGTGNSAVNDTALTQQELSNPVINDKYSQLIVQAEKFIRYDKLDRAAEMYKKILEDEPTHLGALNGMNVLVNIYLQRAGALMDQNKFQEALSLYEKIYQLQPGNQKINELIIVCRNRAEMQTQDSTGAPDSTQSK